MKSLSLRGVAALVVLMSAPSAQAQTNALAIPPTLEGPTYDLEMHHSTHEFFNGVATNTMAFNGSYLGPTLILNAGDDVQMNVTNLIGETTTVHWHGMHVAPEDDGGPHTMIQPNTTWSPDFTVLEKATTFWYHPHLHEHTNEHVYMGLAGMIIVRDDEEAALALPRTYGVDDIPLVLQDRDFDGQNQLNFRPGGAGAGGNTMVINGTIEPYLEVGAQIVRFRIVNGSGARVYNLGFEDGRTFQQIGSDGGLLEAPVALNRVRLAPGERAELLVDFSSDQGGTLDMMSFASELTNGETGGAPPPGGPPPRGLDGSDFSFMEIRVGSPGTGAITAVPTQLVAVDRLDDADVDRTRTMVLNGGGPGNPFTINGLTMDMEVINETVLLGDKEIWELRNTTPLAHPFHIHDVQFYILDRNGVAPPANEMGRKDVVLVEPDEVVRFVTVFEDFADPEIPYMYHCHLLGHEDDGMMGQFIVVDPLATTTEPAPELPRDVLATAAYPNPFSSRTTVSYTVPERSPVSIEVFDLLGRPVQRMLLGERVAGQYEIAWEPMGQPAGTYAIRVQVGDQVSTQMVSLLPRE